MSDDTEKQTKSLLVFGALRSGSTLLRLILDSHPFLYCNGEHDYLFDYAQFDEEEGRWIFDIEGLKLNRIFASQELICPKTTDAKLAVNEILDQLRKRSSGNLVIMIHRNLNAALALLDEALVVHLIRDPRDVAASSIGMGWAGNVYYGADHWIATEREWLKFSPRISPSSRHTLRFEKLIADPLSQLTDLCSFLGVEFSGEMLEFHRSTTYDPINPHLASQWKTKRSDREIALIEARVGELLSVSGFEPVFASPVNLSVLDRASLWLNNKSSTWSLRIRRYGFWDSFWVALTNRFGLKNWSKQATLRINEKSKQYLK